MASGVWSRGALVAGLAVGIGAAALSCQSYELVPVEARAVGVKNTRVQVTGKPLPSNIMLVVDKSGSMTGAVTGTGMHCTADGTSGSYYDPRSTNPCKWNDLRDAFADPENGVLVRNQGTARFGLLAFPGAGSECAEGGIVVPIGDDVQPVRDQLLNQLSPGGGTPTAAALRAAGSDPALSSSEPNRKRFVMLLTDGLPNCNGANAALCSACRSNSAACSSEGGCQPTEPPFGSCSAQPFDGAACLDESGLVDAVAELNAKGIVTLVIGFGKDTASGNATRVLNRAAIAGGHPREGASESYYQANSVEELREFLEELVADFPCTYKLDPVPSEASLVSVNLHDSKASRIDQRDRLLEWGTDWEFTSNALEAVRLIGSACDIVRNAEYGRYEVQIIQADPL
jgi:hypothetical protein